MTFDCLLCGETTPAVLEHLRLCHPDEYGDGVETWPDGKPVVVDLSDLEELT